MFAGAGGGGCPAGGNDLQWCFSQVKGAIDEDVAEGKAAHLARGRAGLRRASPRGRTAPPPPCPRSPGKPPPPAGGAPARREGAEVWPLAGEAAPRGYVREPRSQSLPRTRVLWVHSGLLPAQVAASCARWSCGYAGLGGGVTAGWRRGWDAPCASLSTAPRAVAGLGPSGRRAAFCDAELLSVLSPQWCILNFPCFPDMTVRDPGSGVLGWPRAPARTKLPVRSFPRA